MVFRDPKSGHKFKFTGGYFWILLWFWCNQTLSAALPQFIACKVHKFNSKNSF